MDKGAGSKFNAVAPGISTKVPVFVLLCHWKLMLEPEATAVGAASEVIIAGSPPTQMV